MQILAINGSMRKKGNTNFLIETALESAKKTKPSIKTKVIQITDLNIQPCHACYEVCSKIPYKCVTKNDDFQMVFDEMKRADAIIIGAPVYYIIPSRLTAIIERFSCLTYFYEVRNHKTPVPLEGKSCGLIAVCALDSPLPVLEHLHKFASFMCMKPVNLKMFPYLGVAGRDELEKDTYYKPIEKAKVLGSLLAKAILRETRKAR